MRDFRDRRVTVMGLGAFGGGEGVVRFLSDRDARITLTDLKTEADLAPTLARLDGCRLDALHLGGHHEDDFRDTDLVVVNPAVPRANPFLELARSAGVELTSEINLFIELNRGGVAAVTGSIGKSTTTALLERMVAAAGMTTWLGGNIGRSLLPEVDSIKPDHLVFLELSSFQLADLDRIQFRPDVAVVTNLRPNHLDWHPDLADYRRAKQTILRWQRPDDIAVLNADDPDVSRWPTRGLVRWFGHRTRPAPAQVDDFEDDEDEAEFVPREIVETPPFAGCFVDDMTLVGPQFEIDLRADFPVPGRHHALNAAAACTAALAIGAGESAIRTALKSFTGLPHRLQFVGIFHGRRFFDDSKATTPEAAIAALEAFEEPVVLLAGGYDKHVDLAPFAQAIAQRTRAVALMGQTSDTMATLLRDAISTASGSRLKENGIRIASSFNDACRYIFEQSLPDDAIVLSPGCASYGWFNNYVERGQAFTDAVTRWAAGDVV